MPARLPIDRDMIAAFCQRHRIRKLSLFGSVLRDDFGPDSDVDVLVEFEPDAVPGLLRLAHMQNELTDMLGREVQLLMPEELNPCFREDVLHNAELQYVAA